MAAQALERQGYRILERNFRCPLGEINLIGRDGAVLVFVEVKTRRSPDFDPSWAMTLRKQKHLVRTAQWYLKGLRRSAEPYCRFDAVFVSGSMEAPHDAKVTVQKGVFQSER